MNMTDRVPPHSIDSERAVLGGSLLNPSALPSLPVESFYRIGHQIIYTAMRDLETIDTATLTDLLRKRDELERAGGLMYLVELTNAVPTVDHIQHHADIVAGHYRSRNIIFAAFELADKAYGEGVDEALTAFDECVASTDGGMDGGEFVGDMLQSSFAAIEDRFNGGATGFDTGYKRLDDAIQICPGDVVVLAGRPGMGKTGLGLSISRRGASKGQKVLFVSLEMTRAQLMDRLISQVGLVDSRSIRTGKLTERDWPKLTHAIGVIKDYPLRIVEDAYTSQRIEQIAAKMKRKDGLDLVVVDHIHEMTEKGDTEHQRVGSAAKGLRRMAKKLNVPVLALAQLNRGVESRTIPIPAMSDLRESGTIEEVASSIILMYRQDYYEEQDKLSKIDPKLQGIGRMYIAKHRHGPTGFLDLTWVARYTDYEETDRWS